jgi:hypothetical protein
LAQRRPGSPPTAVTGQASTLELAAEMFVASTAESSSARRPDHDQDLGHGDIRGGRQCVPEDEQHNQAHTYARRESTAQGREQLQHRPWPLSIITVKPIQIGSKLNSDCHYRYRG